MLTMQIEQETIEQMVTNSGQTISELSFRNPILLVFLRHFGCTFCREALSDISKLRKDIESNGIEIIFVHMAEDEVANKYFARYKLDGSKHVSDPACRFYSAFGLVKGNFTQLFGLKSWIRGFQAGVLDGHGVGNQLGDGFQMPGVFVIQNGEVINSFIHKFASDRPDYTKMVDCCAM